MGTVSQSAVYGQQPLPILPYAGRRLRRDREVGKAEADGFGSRHLTSPCLAKIIRVTLSDRSSLLRIQQVTPSASTARKTSAASAGRPDLARKAAGSIPAIAQVVRFRAFFTVHSCGAVIAA